MVGCKAKQEGAPPFEKEHPHSPVVAAVKEGRLLSRTHSMKHATTALAVSLGLCCEKCCSAMLGYAVKDVRGFVHVGTHTVNPGTSLTPCPDWLQPAWFAPPLHKLPASVHTIVNGCCPSALLSASECTTGYSPRQGLTCPICKERWNRPGSGQKRKSRLAPDCPFSRSNTRLLRQLLNWLGATLQPITRPHAPAQQHPVKGVMCEG